MRGVDERHSLLPTGAGLQELGVGRGEGGGGLGWPYTRPRREAAGRNEGERMSERQTPTETTGGTLSHTVANIALLV